MLKKTLLFVFLLTGTLSYSQSSYEKIRAGQAVSYGEKVIRISVAGEQGSTGTFSLTDAAGKVVMQISEMELIPAPAYSTISAEGLEPGDYRLSVDTDGKAYHTTITIQ
jgi:hypothetical protein